MSDFTTQAVSAAQELTGELTKDHQRSNQTVSSPIAVAGLADTVRQAIDGMARAKQSADALRTKAQRLVGNVANVDSIARELDTANEQLEQAVAAVGIPLDNTVTPSNDTGEVPTGVVPPTTADDLGITANSPEHGIKLSLNAVEAA